MIYGYVRVSTQDQILDLQKQALQKSKIDFLVEEITSSTKKKPKLYALLDKLQEGDILKVWKIDRLARSLKELIDISEIINSKKAHLLSITENLDTNSPLGKMYFYMTGLFAEIERNLISERTIAGLKAAKKRGAKIGRKKGPTKVVKGKIKKAKILYKKGERISNIAKILIISRATLYKYLFS